MWSNTSVRYGRKQVVYDTNLISISASQISSTRLLILYAFSAFARNSMTPPVLIVGLVPNENLVY